MKSSASHGAIVGVLLFFLIFAKKVSIIVQEICTCATITIAAMTVKMNLLQQPTFFYPYALFDHTAMLNMSDESLNVFFGIFI